MKNDKLMSNDSTDTFYFNERSIIENFYINPKWTRLFEAFKFGDCENTPVWFSRKLNIALTEVTEILEALVQVGLCTRTNNGYERVYGRISLELKEQKDKSHIKEKYNFSIKTSTLLQHFLENRSSFLSAGLASNKKLFDEYLFEVEEAFEKLIAKSNKSASDGIYFANFFTTKTDKHEEN